MRVTSAEIVTMKPRKIVPTIANINWWIVRFRAPISTLNSPILADSVRSLDSSRISPRTRREIRSRIPVSPA